MRRALPAFIATVFALILLASFHTAHGTVALGVTQHPTTPVTPPDTPATGSPPSTASPPPTTAAATGSRRVVDGAVETNRYGDVQVEVTLQGARILDVQALQLPSDRERSAEISSVAGPLLRQEALQAQSANIDTISGATYTSESYKRSLQNALDKAGVK